jgi:hypothetical protein
VGKIHLPTDLFIAEWAKKLAHPTALHETAVG